MVNELRKITCASVIHIRGVSRWFPENLNKKKPVILATFCIFSFCQYGRQRSSLASGSALITAGAPRRSSPPCYFSYPHLSSYRRPPERELRPRPPLKQWERCLQMSKDRGRHRFGRLIRPESPLLHFQGKPFFHRLLWELRRSHESGVNRFGRHVKGLSEFLDILSPVILQFGGHIGDERLCVEISLIGRCRRRFLYFAFDNRLLTSFSSRPVHGRPSGQFPESS